MNELQIPFENVSSHRRAVIEWATGQQAELTAAGWTVTPHDATLAELLNGDHSLAAAQARRGSLVPPDLLAFAALRGALDTGAEVLAVDPPVAITERSPTR